MTRADTIARHVTQAATHIKTALELSHEPGGDVGGCVDAAARCINAAFLECLGGAAVAREAAGPWVVRGMLGQTAHYSLGPADEGATSHLSVAYRFATKDEAEVDATAWAWADPVTVLPLAEAERMEAAATLASLPAHTQQVLAEPGDEEPSAEVLAADDSSDELAATSAPHELKPSTPEPPKPAGWVVRGIGTDGTVRFSRGGDRSFATELRGAYVYESKPLADADAESGGTWRDVVVLPVDAAGNVLESLPGVAWEAARAGEEAERLRGEVARLHETLRDVSALADEHANEWHALLDHARTAADEVCGPQPVISAREAVTLIERKAFGLRAEAERLRTELAAVKAERDAARAELQWQVRPADIAVSTNGSSIEAEHVPSGVKVRGGSRSEVLYRCQEERATRAEAERDALAGEMQRGLEQKPVRWAVVNPYAAIVCVYADVDHARQHAVASGYRVAPLYLAPVVRDHSGVIAQCEEALREWDSKGAHCSATSALVAVTLTKARNALRGAS